MYHSKQLCLYDVFFLYDMLLSQVKLLTNSQCIQWIENTLVVTVTLPQTT